MLKYIFVLEKVNNKKKIIGIYRLNYEIKI